MSKTFLKRTGLHHGLPSLGLIVVAHLIHPLLGWSVVCVIGLGYFTGREVSQSQYRIWSNNPKVIWQNIERWDLLTPCIMGVLYLIYNWVAGLSNAG